MKTGLYKDIEVYMHECMKDSAHDKEHVYRVLYMALEIAQYESTVDMEVLVTACLLHDIGREEQYKNPELCHAQVGSEKAYDFLIKIGFIEGKAAHIRDCILSHRYRNDNLPQSIEAKILYDADKLDATGTLGVARTLVYKGITSEPIYSVDKNGNILEGTEDDTDDSFFHEYKYKLEKLYNNFFTLRGCQIAEERKQSAVLFYENMLKEVKACYRTGKVLLSDILS